MWVTYPSRERFFFTFRSQIPDAGSNPIDAGSEAASVRAKGRVQSQAVESFKTKQFFPRASIPHLYVSRAADRNPFAVRAVRDPARATLVSRKPKDFFAVLRLP